MFPITSRYYTTPTTEMDLPDGRTVVYLQRRFLPPVDRLEPIAEHTVKQGERLDHIAAEHIGDPEQFWQVADANDAMQPNALTETPGRRLVITLPASAQMTSFGSASPASFLGEAAAKHA